MRGGCEHGVSSDELKVGYLAFLVDDGLKDDCSLNALGIGWIFRLHLGDQQALHHTGDANALRNRLRCRAREARVISRSDAARRDVIANLYVHWETRAILQRRSEPQS